MNFLPFTLQILLSRMMAYLHYGTNHYYRKAEVKSQKYYGIGFLEILDGCSISAVAY